jgi:type I restriction enzyme, S subunit
VSEPNGQQLPLGWAAPALGEIASINPALDHCVENDDIKVAFVPMRAVEVEGGGLTAPEVRRFGEVKNGYTSFRSGDVIMAKITPCMENGKITVVPDVPGRVCFGSTEFHSIRPEPEIQARWISWYLLQHETRRAAQRQMTGAVGQMRVPAAFLESRQIPLAPAAEQEHIADALDELFSDFDAGVAALERVREKLKLYRASVLKAAVEGALTAEWRAQQPHNEPASELLRRILDERRRRWENGQLRKFKERGQEPLKNWKAKYKKPVGPVVTNLPSLPEGWCWVTVEQVSILVTDGDHNPPKRVGNGVPHLTAKNVKGLKFIFDDCSFISPHDACRVFRRYQPEAGDLVITCVGTVGRTAVVPVDLEFSPDRNLAAVRFSGIGPIVIYVQLFFEAPNIQSKLMSVSGSTAQPHLYLGDLRSLPVALPSLPEQEAIVEAVEDQLSVIDHLEADLDAKFKSAQGLRQAILRHAFTGKLVPQDPNDEPALELLKRIAAKRGARAREAAAPKLAKKNTNGLRLGRRRRKTN